MAWNMLDGRPVRPVYREVAVRDDFACQRCGARGWDIAHILPKGRYPELKYEAKNMVVLCRKCHKATENAEGRKELLALMQARYGYAYLEPQYRGYLEGNQDGDDGKEAG